MFLRILLATLALTFLLPAAQAGPVHDVYDTISPAQACFASTIPVTGEPTCVDFSPLWPAYPGEVCLALPWPRCYTNPL